MYVLTDMNGGNGTVRGRQQASLVIMYPRLLGVWMGRAPKKGSMGLLAVVGHLPALRSRSLSSPLPSYHPVSQPPATRGATAMSLTPVVPDPLALLVGRVLRVCT